MIYTKKHLQKYHLEKQKQKIDIDKQSAIYIFIFTVFYLIFWKTS